VKDSSTLSPSILKFVSRKNVPDVNNNRVENSSVVIGMNVYKALFLPHHVIEYRQLALAKVTASSLQ
jgi:hypothetical protein